jgi:hypothetical protein
LNSATVHDHQWYHWAFHWASVEVAACQDDHGHGHSMTMRLWTELEATFRVCGAPHFTLHEGISFESSEHLQLEVATTAELAADYDVYQKSILRQCVFRNIAKIDTRTRSFDSKKQCTSTNTKKYSLRQLVQREHQSLHVNRNRN